MIIGIFKIFSLTLDTIVAVFPLIAYYSQLQLIRTTNSLGTFSIDVCAILLMSSILRVYFWFTNGYAINLFFQAIFIIGIQLVLLKQCISRIPADKHDPESFWRWKSYRQYIKFLVDLTIVVTVITVISQLIYIPYYKDLLGFISLTIQGALGLPQLISNHRTKSVRGLSLVMIGSWFIGDSFKTVYFFLQTQPFQFIICGIVQLTVDILIIFQILRYKKPITGYKQVKLSGQKNTLDEQEQVKLQEDRNTLDDSEQIAEE